MITTRDQVMAMSMDWLVHGMIDRCIHGCPQGRHRREWNFRCYYEIGSREVGFRFRTPYWMLVFGPEWSIMTTMQPRGVCPVIGARGDLTQAMRDLTIARLLMVPRASAK
ncbi:MAG: hypothetical protein EOP83_21840 [Verrucomicrobiaceae bacterium]|nr:MAG: hypothetical protein EOP83_21840 [Verrucomicrobiaceae bacterium]